MTKDLSEIEDEYNDSYEKLTEEFCNGIRRGGEHDRLRKKYKRNFQKILKKRNKAYLRYLKKHKKDLLEMPEKKKKKEKKKGVYKAHHIDFKQTFLTKFKRILKEMGFKLSLFFRNLKYNFIPSWLKFSVFRVRLFLSSVFSDISLFFKEIRLDIYRVFGRFFERIKKKVLKIFSIIKTKTNKIIGNNKLVDKKKKANKEKEKKV